MESVKFWDLAKLIIKEKVTNTMYSIWIEPLKLSELSYNHVEITCKSEFVRTLIIEKFGTVIKDALEEVTGMACDITYVVDSNPTANDNADLFKQHRFDNFPVTAANKKAYESALEVAEKSAAKLNPLFVFGGSKEERSHLFNAIINYFADNYPESRFIYRTIENYSSEVIKDVRVRRERHMSEHKESDFFLLEGLSCIEQSEIVQRKLAVLIKTLVFADRQIVIISDVPIEELHLENEELLGLLKNSHIVSMNVN